MDLNPGVRRAKKVGRDTTKLTQWTLRISVCDIFIPSGLPAIEVKSMSITQSIDAPLTTSDTAVLSGNLSTQNGNGNGSFNVSYRRIFSYQSWGEVREAVDGWIPI